MFLTLIYFVLLWSDSPVIVEEKDNRDSQKAFKFETILWHLFCWKGAFGQRERKVALNEKLEPSSNTYSATIISKADALIQLHFMRILLRIHIDILW